MESETQELDDPIEEIPADQVEPNIIDVESPKIFNCGMLIDPSTKILANIDPNTPDLNTKKPEYCLKAFKSTEFLKNH